MNPIAPSSSSYPPGDQPQFAEPRGPDGRPAFDPGAPESITESMLVAGVRALLLGAGRVTEAMLAAAVSAKLNPGAWEAIAPNANLEAQAGAQTFAARSEAGATIARLRGGMKIKAALEIAAGATIATLPVGLRPPASVNVIVSKAAANGFIVLTIAATGIITAASALPAGEQIWLDGATFNLT